MSLPIRFHIALMLVGLNVVGTVVIALYAYRVSRQTLQEQALSAAGAVADAREQAIERAFQERRQRLDSALASLEALCGERGTRGRLALERECVHAVVAGLDKSEHAVAVELRNGRQRAAARGTWPGFADPPNAPAVAIVGVNNGALEYTIMVRRGPLALRARFPLHDVDSIFQDRSGLSPRGEAFLADARGVPLTQVRDSSAAAVERVEAMPSIQHCRRGESGELVTGDYTGATVISAFRPSAAIPGGCVVADLPFADAFAPITRLGRRFVYASAAWILIGFALAFLVAHAIATPISRLAIAASDMEAGKFDQPVRTSGPSEVQRLARAFSKMAHSTGELVRREQAARAHAEQASRLKDEFLATLSHELRTPLTAILGWASIISREPFDGARTAHALDVIKRNAERQVRLIEDLLDISRLVSGQMRFEPASVRLTAVIDEAMDAVRPNAEARHIALLPRYETPGAFVTGDADRLQQVVWNLLSNAVRFTPPDGRIEVVLRETGGHAEIRVNDNGAGLAPDFIAHAFEPFRQADSSTTRPHGGLGIGLAIVRHIVELHGGTVRAESGGEGRGSSFVVLLPLQPEAGANAPHGALRPSERTTPLDGRRVLVVDDEPDTREVLRAILEKAGATVTTTSSAGETREILPALRPDLLIADIGMPDEDGYSLMRSVRAFESEAVRRVPAIALTAHARAEDADCALASGFQIHLPKPVEAERLVSTVSALMSPAA